MNVPANWSNNRMIIDARKWWGWIRWYTSAPGIRQLTMRVQYFGYSVKCPYCGWRGREFYPHPEPHPRKNAYCPRCFAKERHRLLRLYLGRMMNIESGAPTILEIAPGPYSVRYFSNLPRVRYITFDLESPIAMARADIGRLPLPDDAFDVVICYHVLEHISDDIGAMAELYRVLKPTGILLVQVPIITEVTEEDPEIVDPLERLRRYGQDDHVRNYGLDFYDRLHSSGFIVRHDDFASRLSPAEISRYGLDSQELITCCSVNKLIVGENYPSS